MSLGKNTILYIHRTQGKGVEAVHINSIIDAMQKKGHNVVQASPQGIFPGVTSNNTENKEPEKSGIKWYSVISKSLPEIIFELAEIAYNILAIRRVLKQTRDNKFDMLFERYAIFSVVGAYLSKKYKKPLILEINYTSLTPLVRKRSALLKPLARLVDNWMFKRATGFAAVSSHLKQQLIDEFNIPSEKIIVLPNAADYEKFAMDIPPLKKVCGKDLSGYKVIGFVGGFYPWHGLDLLLKSFVQITKLIPKVILLLVGDGPERGRIQAMAEDYGIWDCVIFAGKAEHNILPQYMSTFDIGVMPDSNEYGSPMKIFEYMSMGKPVVVPDYPPLLDVIDQGVEGFIFKRNEVDSLTQSIKNILADEDLYKIMSKAARSKIIDKHHWDNNAEAILNLYQR